MRIWNVIRNATEVHAKTGKTPYQFRHKTDFPYELIPLGAELTYMPTSPTDMKKLNKFSAKAGLQGVMLGYKLKVGG